MAKAFWLKTFWLKCLEYFQYALNAYAVLWEPSEASTKEGGNEAEEEMSDAIINI